MADYQVVRLGDLIEGLLAENETAVEARRSGKLPGPITGLPTLDTTMGGYFAKGLHILQSGPGDGKTALALQIAATCGFPCLYVTAEMPVLELFRRLIARATNTPLGKLKSGELSSRDVTKLAHQTAEKSPWLVILDATRGYVSPEAIREVGEALRDRSETSQTLIILDSLQYWARGAGAAAEYDLISSGVRSMVEVAAQLSCPVIAISHRNRAGNKGDGGMFAGKGSGDLEYLAESVLELSREKGSKPDASGKIPTTLTIHKNRHGEPGRVIMLEFTGRLQLFAEKGV